jgi:hypothetical protein
MSEYQYYEFVALDQPLDDRQQDEVRSLSTRATITATSFVNEYHWGNFRGDPNHMMERYYDAHLYLANWGTHRIMFRLPRTLLDADAVVAYCDDEHVRAWAADEFLVLDLTSEDESGEWDYDGEASLSAIVGVRAELAGGDLRPLYLAWLAGFAAWAWEEEDLDDYEDTLEPPVPPGLGSLTASQRALAEFLRVDDDLLEVAARTSPPVTASAADSGDVAAWVVGLPSAEKDRLLRRFVEDNAVAVRMGLHRRFRDQHATATPEPPRRRVSDLLQAATQLRADGQLYEAAQRAAERARIERDRALARERRLDELSRDENAAWSRVDALIATRKPGEYDAAVALLTDLRALATRDGRGDAFTQRSATLRKTHARKPSLIDRLERAGI